MLSRCSCMWRGGPTTDCRLRICTVVVQCMLQGMWAPRCLLVHVGRDAVVNMLGTWFRRYPVAMVFVDVHSPVQEDVADCASRSSDCAVDRVSSRMSCSVYWLIVHLSILHFWHGMGRCHPCIIHCRGMGRGDEGASLLVTSFHARSGCWVYTATR